MKKILFILNIIALILSICWYLNERTLEPLISSITLTATLLAFIGGGNDNPTMKQKGGKNSKNYQAGRDLNI